LPETAADRSKTAAGLSAAAGAYSTAATKTAFESETNEVGLAVSDSGYSGGDAAPGSEIEQIKTTLEKRRKMFLVMALEGARNATLEDSELCLEFAPDTRHFRDTLAKSDNVKILREVCKEITGRDLGVRFVISDPEASAASAAADAPPSKEEAERREKKNMRERAEKDPTVQQMLKTFRGEIVDVKRAEPAK